MYSATMVLDSITARGHRLATMEVVMPRIVLAEFNTHRMLSRNSASSRAIPFKKMASSVEENPFVPLRFMKEHSGMQGTEYFDHPMAIAQLEESWHVARELAVKRARILNEAGLSKQICNRILEPFMWHKVLVSATEWENFFALRAESHAEIHMQKVAETMLECMNNSTPRLLKPGEWHAPYGDQIDQVELHALVRYLFPDAVAIDFEVVEMIKLKIATARCAQTSYTVVGTDGKPTPLGKLLTIHDGLATNGHWSPFEHCARVMSEQEYKATMKFVDFETGIAMYQSGWCGNFRGFIQYRKMFKNENRSDPRLIKKEVPNG